MDREQLAERLRQIANELDNEVILPDYDQVYEALIDAANDAAVLRRDHAV